MVAFLVQHVALWRNFVSCAQASGVVGTAEELHQGRDWEEMKGIGLYFPVVYGMKSKKLLILTFEPFEVEENVKIL